MTRCALFRQEFTKQHLGFCAENPDDFFLFCWWPHHSRLSRFVFLCYRVLLLVYALYWYVDIMQQPQNDRNSVHHIMAYLTIWSYLLICVYLTWAALVAAVRLASDWRELQHTSRFSPPSVTAQKKETHVATVSTLELMGSNTDIAKKTNQLSFGQRALVQRVQWYLVLQWLLFSILQCVAPLITLCYWIILFPNIGIATNALDVHLHAINTAFVWAELFFSATPVRVCHVVYAFCYCICYLIFSVAYWAVDHDNVVYGDLMNWNKPALAVGYVCMLLVVLLLIQLAVFGLYLLRLALCRYCVRSRKATMNDVF